MNVDLVGKLPIAGKLSALGRVGAISARTHGQFSATGAAAVPYASANPSQSTTSWKLGAGLAYDFTETLAMRVEAERFRASDAVGHKGAFNLVSVGLVYRFGGPTPSSR